MAIFNINLNIDKAKIYTDVQVTHRIDDTATVLATIYDQNMQASPIVVPTDSNPVFKCILPDRKKLIEQASIADNKINYVLSNRFNKVAGNATHCYFEFSGYSTQEFDILILDK